jgi:hypothetical protein
MTKSILAVLLGGMVAIGAAGTTTSKTTKKAGAVTCTFTGKTVSECSCTQKDGKLYCTLAKETIGTCCCKPAVK